MSAYQPSQFEHKLIDLWEKEGVYKTGLDTNKKQYILNMFPYPSGDGLHTGHVRVYTATDVIARYNRMIGKSVLFPMGWDAFGLPAENAAIKQQRNPDDMTREYIGSFKGQIKMLGLSYDWEKEINTTDPSYYAITQWLFIQFFKAGFLYKRDTSVDFCEFCKTGLAQEEVQSDGTHERCGNPVIKKNLPQWIFRITKYANRLLNELEGLDWPRGILEMQKNWIGKKEGINITYQVLGIKGKDSEITVFTTTPVNFGATFLVLAPEHDFVKKILNGEISPAKETYIDTIREYIKKSLLRSEVDRMVEDKIKTGVFTGFYVTNHVTQEQIPVWISDFVLPSVGTGAVQGCPGHDLRDFHFAMTFGLPIKRVVVGLDGNTSEIDSEDKVIDKDKEGEMINSDFLNGLSFKEAMVKTMGYFEDKGWGKRVTTYHLRDWIFSRQRYWGEPIPMVFCQQCADKKISYKSDKFIYPNTPKMDHKISENWGEIDQNLYGWFPISDENLPLELPFLEKYAPTGTGESPLSQATDWLNTKCPTCGSTARRETDTMPNWAGSSWYFLQYAQQIGGDEKSKMKNQKFSIENNWDNNAIRDWLPVDWYIGGAEHAVLHLLYARFWVKILQDLGYVDFNEPFLRLRNVGMVIAEDNRKMSKSYGNVINPNSIVAEYGADALRIYEMFMAPFSQEVAWSTSSLQGSYRFVKRIWQLFNKSDKLTNDESKSDKNITAELQKTIDKVGSDITDVKFNTAIAVMMKFVNTWEAGGSLYTADAKKFLQILAPFAPFMTDQLWREFFGEKESIHLSKWPVVDMSLIKKTNMKLAIQVDGKLRDVLQVDPEADEESVINLSLKSEKVKKYLIGEYQTKYVRGRVINFVNK